MRGSGGAERACIDWGAIAAALGVPVDTLPIARLESSLVAGRSENVEPIFSTKPKGPNQAEGYALTDSEWVIIEPLIPRGPGAGGIGPEYRQASRRDVCPLQHSARNSSVAAMKSRGQELRKC